MSARLPVLVDTRGNPISARTAHYAAELDNAELAAWTPQPMSPDAEWLPEMDRILGRVHDFVRNNGMVNGAIQTQIDNLVGAGLQLSAKPDWAYLGIDDPDVQETIEAQIESHFHLWAYDIDRYCDAGRKLTFGGMVAQAVRSCFTSFEAFATGEWLRRPGAKYRTAIQMIDPLRVCQPDGKPEMEQFKGGIEYDDMGAAIAYHMASRVRTDPYTTFENALITWRRVEREFPWGRRRVIHVYDQERPGQSRGKGGIVSVLARGRMLDKNEQAHLQAAVQNAIFATAITSPMDWQQVGAALGANDPDDEDLMKYLAQRVKWHRDRAIRFGGTNIPHLYPGEKLEHLQPSHPHAAFDAFERVFHRYMAAGLNMTYEQFSRDYSQTNYSGHRAALLDYWRFITGRRSVFGGEFATQIYALWLEEAMDRGEIEIPAGVPGFYDAKCAWCGCEWLGPGRGQIDPLKEQNALLVADQLGSVTQEELCAMDGRDWRKVTVQRAQEAKYRQKIAEKYGVDVSEIKAAGPTRAAQPAEVEGQEERRNNQREGATA